MLEQPERGFALYRDAHLPGAVYAHLDRDLSDLGRRGLGRHPLPHAEAFGRALARWNVAPDTPVIAYDQDTGAYAARLWWLLRCCGHQAVWVLDGGLDAWIAAGLPVEAQVPAAGAGPDYPVHFDPAAVVDAAGVRDALARGGLLLDARGAARFHGEQEPIDPVAGHVPGARNRPFTENLEGGRFKPAERLRAEFSTLLAGRGAHEVIHMCGSGVTACHNALAMAHAGLPGSRLYAASWSGWIEDPQRPVATGAA